MRNKAQDLRFWGVGDLDSFSECVLGEGRRPSPQLPQLNYLYAYLTDIGARFVIEETNYFDRDYLEEFSAFYGVGSQGYPNICRRLHFFGEAVTEELFRDALTSRVGSSERNESFKKLGDAYYGFSVIRPIPAAPFGRTVLAWYPQSEPPRVTNPSREYKVHLIGLPLTVTGLAWQQQDQGVSACATVGLWSMLHASAFNERHSIPTTAEITRAANKNLSFGSRVFPSRGLRVEQICEAIKELGLSPNTLDGDIPSGSQHYPFFFSKSRFASTVAALVRSSYPCMIVGIVRRPDGTVGGHTNVCLGFKEKNIPEAPLQPGVSFLDQDIDHVYIHDDNLGPAVKFDIKIKTMMETETEPKKDDDGNPIQYVSLSPFKKDADREAATDVYGEIIPSKVLFAVENDLRSNPSEFTKLAAIYASVISQFRTAEAESAGANAPTTYVGVGFWRASDYLGMELAARLAGMPAVLARARLQIQQETLPLSLYVGLIRIGDSKGAAMDLIVDTTDGDGNVNVYCSVIYDPDYKTYAEYIKRVEPNSVGVIVEAYSGDS